MIFPFSWRLKSQVFILFEMQFNVAQAVIIPFSGVEQVKFVPLFFPFNFPLFYQYFLRIGLGINSSFLPLSNRYLCGNELLMISGGTNPQQFSLMFPFHGFFRVPHQLNLPCRGLDSYPAMWVGNEFGFYP